MIKPSADQVYLTESLGQQLSGTLVQIIPLDMEYTSTKDPLLPAVQDLPRLDPDR